MYSTEIPDALQPRGLGETTEFGTSGMLYRSNKLMYDRATETLWHQFRGEPVAGPLAGSGVRLKILPSVLTTWSEWLAEHPDTTVISNDTGVYPAEFYTPEEDFTSIYYSYRADPDTMFPVAGIDDRLPIKEQVFGLTFNGQARAYQRSALAHDPALNDTVGGQDVVIVTVAGGAVRAYDRGGLQFQTAPGGLLQDDEGQQWQVLEDALQNTRDPSLRLDRLPSRDAYWFGWHAFYPHTDIYTPLN